MLIHETLFKISLFLLLIPFYFVRIYYSKKYTKSSSLVDIYPIHIKLMIGLSVITLIFLPIMYVITPFIDSFTLYLPDTLRLFGLGLFIFVILSMWWVLRTLKQNFDLNSEDRYLVVTGPYKFVRHPMYDVFVLLGIAQFLISANLVIFLGIPVILILTALRVNFEDKLLVKEFKEAYIDYKKSTKALIPRIW